MKLVDAPFALSYGGKAIAGAGAGAGCRETRSAAAVAAVTEALSRWVHLRVR